MLLTILTSIATFIATGIDELIVLTVLFVYYKNRGQVKDIYIGQQLSMLVLLGISLLAVFGITFIPPRYIGLLGLVPIGMGLKVLFFGEDDQEVEEKELVQKSKKFSSLILSVAFIAVAGGAEELTIYIPYFASLNLLNLIVALIIFNLLVPVWCTLCKKISKIKRVEEKIEKYERIIIPIVFIGLGIFVLIENNTLSLIF